MKIQTIAPPTWTTFNGQVKQISEINQSHLSNIYWFFYIFHNTRMDWIITELESRFNGQLSSYMPHLNHNYEIDYLEKNNMIKWLDMMEGDISKIGVIMLNGKVIGSINKAII